MPFNPKFTITPRINKALVEIERIRGFLDAVKLKDDWIADMQKKAIKYLLRNGTISVNEYQAAASCVRRTAQRDLEDMMGKGIIKSAAKSQTDPTRHYVLLRQVTVTCCGHFTATLKVQRNVLYLKFKGATKGHSDNSGASL
jgi:predicted HTH transcriptional regulator